MTTKFISLATAIVLLDVYLQSQLSSNAPLFLFVSSNIAVNIGLMLITVLMVTVSFRSKFRHWWTFIGCAVAAIFFGLVGGAGIFFGDILYYLPRFLQPLDYMFLIEASVVFGIAAISYEHQKVPAEIKLPFNDLSLNLSLPKYLPRFNNFAFPVLKALQSPSNSHNNRAQAA